ncbi:hypothetical protein BK120_19460 [Paenibacillus sp. FSL A5-0031]|uniref:hypothetical protein n=1 Tax=unclassified Paenibacillus TaxID=185978 RepID=UPI00096BD5ED|nr:hypothetical protein [Paenibacillus sp. FSL A5-0031]OME80023.1 hypothetical protein BK120_19460 [Paenibacillus sp. FSL A5-0031]
MTFKSIDLQMSVPRTQEFSGMHGQAMHKPVADQNTLANQSAKQTELLRGKNTAIEQSNGLHIRSDQEGQQGNAYQQAKRKRTQLSSDVDEQEAAPTHPYKGHRLDIKL